MRVKFLVILSCLSMLVGCKGMSNNPCESCETPCQHAAPRAQSTDVCAASSSSIYQAPLPKTESYSWDHGCPTPIAAPEPAEQPIWSYKGENFKGENFRRAYK